MWEIHHSKCFPKSLICLFYSHIPPFPLYPPFLPFLLSHPYPPSCIQSSQDMDQVWELVDDLVLGEVVGKGDTDKGTEEDKDVGIQAVV